MTTQSRRVFVGRVRERATLARLLDDAAGGNPHVVMVGGEPGIGKTALGREILGTAVERGMQTLSGQCYEQGSLKLPYLPFVEAIEAYAREGWPHGEWPQTALLARIVPGLRALGFEPPPREEGESPYLLFEAVAAFLRLAASEQPIALLLEDLHDADEGTLDLLAHLVQGLIEFGDRARAERVKHEVVALAQRTGTLSTRRIAGDLEFHFAVMDGHLEAARSALANLEQELVDAGLSSYWPAAADIRLRAALYLGKRAEPGRRVLPDFFGGLFLAPVEETIEGRSALKAWIDSGVAGHRSAVHVATPVPTCRHPCHPG